MSLVSRVSFVGAGPGDPELVTLKALRRLREADVVIHDRLVPIEMLGEARAAAEIIDAGKAPGRHCLAQVEINWLLVDRARRRGAWCVSRAEIPRSLAGWPRRSTRCARPAFHSGSSTA